MAQPLFIEVTLSSSGRPFIIGLAHIRRIQPTDEDGCEFEIGEHGFTVIVRESLQQIRAALGVVVQP
jgi:hypothetical protein